MDCDSATSTAVHGMYHVVVWESIRQPRARSPVRTAAPRRRFVRNVPTVAGTEGGRPTESLEGELRSPRSASSCSIANGRTSSPAGAFDHQPVSLEGRQPRSSDHLADQSRTSSLPVPLMLCSDLKRSDFHGVKRSNQDSKVIMDTCWPIHMMIGTRPRDRSG